MFFSTILYRLFPNLGVTTENAVSPFKKTKGFVSSPAIHRRSDVGLPVADVV